MAVVKVNLKIDEKGNQIVDNYFKSLHTKQIQTAKRGFTLCDFKTA